jgi:hypothetical protein
MLAQTIFSEDFDFLISKKVLKIVVNSHVVVKIFLVRFEINQ